MGEPIPDEILGGTQFELPRTLPIVTLHRVLILMRVEIVFMKKLIMFHTGLEVFFVNNTPILDVDRLYAEFETNRPGVLIECHLTHLDNSRVDCKHLAGSCGCSILSAV